MHARGRSIACALMLTVATLSLSSCASLVPSAPPHPTGLSAPTAPITLAPMTSAAPAAPTSEPSETSEANTSEKVAAANAWGNLQRASFSTSEAKAKELRSANATYNSSDPKAFTARMVKLVPALTAFDSPLAAPEDSAGAIATVVDQGFFDPLPVGVKTTSKFKVSIDPSRVSLSTDGASAYFPAAAVVVSYKGRTTAGSPIIPVKFFEVKKGAGHWYLDAAAFANR